MSLSPRDELYITLPSNVPGSQRNTPADYETTLPTELVLTGDWEVALLECHYFHDWSNLSKCDLAIYVRESDNTPQNDQPASDEVDGHWFDEEDGVDNAPKMETAKVQALTDSSSSKEGYKGTDVDDTSSASIVTAPKEPVEIPKVIVEVPKVTRSEADKTGESSSQVAISEPIPSKDDESKASKEPEADKSVQPAKLSLKEFTILTSKLQKSDPENFGTIGYLIHLPESNYEGVKGLCNTICTQFNDKSKGRNVQHKLQYLMENGRVKFFCETAKVWLVSSSPYLFQRLGIAPSQREVDGRTLYLVPHKVMGTTRSYVDDIHSVFVYSDIIDYQIVGNSKAMLLGVFPTKGEHGEQQSWQFNPLQYITVKMRTLQSIRLKLCTPTGNLVPFQSGDTLCRLHFKRKLV